MKIRTWHIIGAVFTCMLGILLHFVYEMSGFHPIFAILGSTNESVWEHLKLLYWPFFITVIFELWIYGKDTSGFFFSKALGALFGMFFIVSAYYTYTGIIGKNFFIADIAIFFAAASAAYYMSYRSIKTRSHNSPIHDIVGFVILLIIAAAFCIFTFSTPQIGIFSVACK